MDNSSEILIEIQTLSCKKISLKILSAKWQPFCLDLNVLTHFFQWFIYLQCFYGVINGNKIFKNVFENVVYKRSAIWLSLNTNIYQSIRERTAFSHA